MATVNKAVLDGIRTGFQVIADDELRLQGEGPLADAGLFLTRQSSRKKEEYNWLGNFVQMEEWIGERTVADFRAYTYTIENLKQQATIEVELDDLDDDDVVGLYDPMIRQLVESWPRKRRRDRANMLLNGDVDAPVIDPETGLLSGGHGYDGEPFFSNSHPKLVDGSTQRNIIGLSGDSGWTDGTLSGANIDRVIETMMLLTDDADNPLGIMPDTLVVGPKQAATARDIFSPERNANGATNVYQDYFINNIVVEPFLGSTLEWFLFDTSLTSAKPFIMQNRLDVQFQALDSINSSFVFHEDKVRFGLKSRYGLGYGFWQTAFMGTGVDNT